MGPSFRFGKIALNFLISSTAFKGAPKLCWDRGGDLKVGIKCLKKTVLVVPKHSPKSEVRNEKTFFDFFFNFFGE